MTSRAISAVFVCAIGVAMLVSVHADVRATKRDAAILKQKVATINAHAEKASKVARRTIVTEIGRAHV